MKLSALKVLLCVTPICVFADQTLETKSIGQVFSEGSSTAGFYTVEGLPQCKYQIMYIDLSDEAGKAQFSMVLSAKAAGQKVVRMDYNLGPDNRCDLTGLHVK